MHESHGLKQYGIVLKLYSWCFQPGLFEEWLLVFGVLCTLLGGLHQYQKCKETPCFHLNFAGTYTICRQAMD